MFRGIRMNFIFKDTTFWIRGTNTKGPEVGFAILRFFVFHFIVL